jgi:hypothetical protein
MREDEDTKPFPREPWQRLLEDDESGGPPETTDARIRKAARRDLAPRGRRWWLPASLAASFVLAVFVVQSQFGSLRVPVTTESDHGAGGAIEARIIDREDADAARPDGRSPAAAPTHSPGKRDEVESDDYGYQDSELAADSAGTGPRVGGPERELKARASCPMTRRLRPTMRPRRPMPASSRRCRRLPRSRPSPRASGRRGSRAPRPGTRRSRSSARRGAPTKPSVS